MPSRINKLVLTSHLTFSVGWLGAVAVFLALAITGLNTNNIQLARAAYIAMEVSAWFVIVPFCIASLITGIVQSLITKWGLFRYYWVVVKLFLTIVATVLLLLHLKPIEKLAGVALDSSFSNTGLPSLKIQMIADAAAAILLLLGIITISIYKPWGKISLRQRSADQFEMNRDSAEAVKRSYKFYLVIGLVMAILFVIIKHLLSGGMGKH